MKEFKNFYSSIKDRKFITWCTVTDRIDTYGRGCVFNCGYCYAKNLLEFRGYWGNPIKANLYKIGRKIMNLPKDRIIKLGGMTDCFQPIELKERVTYETIKLLNYHKIHYLIVTKSDNVARNEYVNIYSKKLAHFQVTITNTNDIECIKYENAPPTSRRIYAIEKLYKNGFDVSVRLSPFIEGFVNYDKLNSIECDKILIEFLKVNSFVKSGLNIDYSDYMVKYGGRRHLSLYKQLIMIKPITEFKQITIGASVPEHYKFYRDNKNYNKKDCCNLDVPNLPKYKQLQLWA